MQKVDELSKKVVFKLCHSMKEAVKARFKCEVLEVNHNDIANTLAMISIHKLVCVMLVPRWEGKSWWSILQETVTELYPIDSMYVKFSVVVDPGWEFMLARFKF